MDEAVIPEEVRRFIVTCFPSVPHLEALLLLRRDPAVAWDPARLARRLYIDDKTAADVLRDLTTCQLAAGNDPATGYRYEPGANAEMVDRVAQLYARALVAVTNLIHGRNAQLFADAFKLRKD